SSENVTLILYSKLVYYEKGPPNSSIRTESVTKKSILNIFVNTYGNAARYR
ncbi:997_t:CDS:1, partial [Paraglomus brasilianum]